MKTRFPLYAKILFWFFLNVLILVAVFFFVARMQFRFGLDSLIAGRAGERMQAIARLVSAEFRERPRHEWSSVLARYSEAYAVEFFLFRNDGSQLAGAIMELPPEVLGKIRDRRGFVPMARRPNGEERRPPFVGPPEFAPPGREPRQPPLNLPPPNPMPTSMLRTSEPNRYWVLVPIIVLEQESYRQMPVTLIAVSQNLSGGGLFFDFTPWLVATIAVILISVAFWFPLVRGITRSISRITNATERMAEGKFDVRLEDQRRDELGLLGDSVNRMGARLAGFVSGQKSFLGDIAHELCSPIARMQMALGILEQKNSGRENPYLTDLREEVEQMSNLVNELLSFSKASLGKSKLKLQPVNLLEIVAKAVGRETASTKQTEIKVEVAEDLRVIAEPELLLRSISNVLRNAIRYAGEEGPITISTVRDGSSVTLNIDDCGKGIPEEAIEQVFDPFYRIDSSRSRETGGVGLGLSIVKTCVESCGGTVNCENRASGGLRISIRLPIAR